MFIFGLTKCLPTGGNCISNTFRTGRVARYTTQATPAKTFFNRKRELVNFKNAFSADPELHVVLGPPSSGKTALVREVTRNKDDFSPIFINCRIGQFDTPKRIYDSISSQFEPFFKKHVETFKNLFEQGEISYIMNDIQLKIKPFGGDERAITSNDVTKLLDDIANSLPKWNRWFSFKVPPPILVIDEANMFSQLGSSEEGKVLLKSILNWMVVNTKERGLFPIVLTSSDSFFFNWIVNLLHVPHVSPYVVGDLGKEEAKEYFEEHVLPRYECKELEGKFDHVRKMTGTRMLIIDRYVKEYKNSGGKLEDREFSIYVSEYNMLNCGLYPKNLIHPDKPNPPLWKDYDLIEAMKAILDKEGQGYILQKDLFKVISPERVDSLVDYNFLHRRPTKRFARDINPPDEIILTAMNQPSLRAMERIIEENKANDSQNDS